MQKKFKRGDKVQIIQIENKLILDDYPDINQNLWKKGEIVDDGMTIESGGVLLGLKEPLPPQPSIETVIYRVKTENSENVVRIPQEALVLLTDSEVD